MFVLQTINIHIPFRQFCKMFTVRGINAGADRLNINDRHVHDRGLETSVIERLHTSDFLDVSRGLCLYALDVVFSDHSLNTLFRVHNGDHLQIVPGKKVT